jgi:uncharacterized Zn finger protein
MVEIPPARSCPICGVTEVPTLLIRGSGLTGHGWVIRCRTCGGDWSESMPVPLRTELPTVGV